MKSTSKIIFFLSLFVVGRMMFDLSSCTNEDQIIEPKQVVNSGTDLLSVKVTTPPTLDGAVDPLWADCPILEFSTAVPEVTGDVFRGYTGNIIPSVKLRSVYDAENIYFLAEWDDPTESLQRGLWYFDPTSKKWAQEKGTFDFDKATNGNVAKRNPFYEDKISMLWNIDNSVKDWNTATCYKSCHTGLPAADGSSRHFTNFGTEKIDMWHWKSVRGGVNAAHQIHDQFQDNTYPNGRKGDTGGADVYLDNRITIDNITVPKYVILNRANNNWILNSEITDGTAKLVTGVDANGVLTFSDNTTLDPNVGSDYLRASANTAPKAIAGVTINDIGYVGATGDISCKAVWANSKWTMELKRKLAAPDAYDVDFSSLADQYFGFAIFENAQIAHSIKPNLVLKFKK
ncbi:MAG: ethylbenzene dehydrogenase-related protein [Cyclobacteriaceae bacterium]